MSRARDEATSQVYALLVGGTIFLSILGLILYHSAADVTGSEPVEAAAAEADAHALLASLLDSQGVGWDGGADSIVRVGLGDDGLAGLDLDHVELLRSAGTETDPDNGLVDHDELVESLGLDPDEVSVRLTIERVFEDAEDRMDEVFPVTRAAYIGDWNSMATIKVGLGTPEAMEAEARADIDARMFADAELDRSLVAQLGLEFDDRVYVAAAAPTVVIDLPGNQDPSLLSVLNIPLLEGDVYPDSKQYLDIVLASRLPLYDALIVGTGVDHNALASDGVKGAIEAWVMAGGTLFVLGSPEAHANWLQPLFHLSLRNEHADGTAPDPSHGILNAPYDLQWASYDHGNKAWDIGDDASAGFDHILLAGENDVLSMAHKGAFGEGHLTITTILLDAMVDDLGEEEALRFLSNVLIQMRLQDDLDVSLQFGPEPPDGATVTQASRVTQVWDEENGAWIPVRARLLVWTDPVA